MPEPMAAIALLGEILQLLGLFAILGALIEGWGHWAFEVPAVLGLAALLVGRRLRHPRD